MSTSQVVLGPRLFGGEVLARLAHRRATGVLTWNIGGTEAALRFRGGRPQSAVFRGGDPITDRDQVVGFVRAFAILSAGDCTFDICGVESSEIAIDTMGEVLIAFLKSMQPGQLEPMWEARRAFEVEAGESFDKVAAAIAKVGGAVVPRPGERVDLGSLVAGASLGVQRALAVLIALGGFRVSGAKSSEAQEAQPSGADDALRPLTGRPQTATPPVSVAPVGADSKPKEPKPAAKPTTKAAAKAAAKTGAKPSTSKAGDARPGTGAAAASSKPRTIDPRPRSGKLPPKDSEARKLFFEIEKAHDEAERQSHYEFLGVDAKSSPDTIRKGYFETAKRWHSDRFGGSKLEDADLKRAQELFLRTEEAYRVLGDADERKSYDFVLDRLSRGLPTDPKVIMEAERLFDKGQTMIRRGEAAAAEPLLRKAVELNSGEPEFFIYHGFALYSARGGEAVEEARAQIQKGIGMRDTIDAGYEFLGKIARIEGDIAQATREFRRALDINPRNVDAQRELRLLGMRRRETASTGKVSGFLNRFNKAMKK